MSLEYLSSYSIYSQAAVSQERHLRISEEHAVPRMQICIYQQILLYDDVMHSKLGVAVSHQMCSGIPRAGWTGVTAAARIQAIRSASVVC